MIQFFIDYCEMALGYRSIFVFITLYMVRTEISGIKFQVLTA